jgi:hypothetical protein
MVVLTYQVDGESQLRSTSIPDILGFQECFDQAQILVMTRCSDRPLATFRVREYPFLAVCQLDRLSLPKFSTLAEAIIDHTRRTLTGGS